MRIKRSRSDKVIVPSKHGYHPRSHSPTFRRLIAAAELLAQYETSLEDPRVTMSSSEIFDFLNAKFVKRDNLEGGGHSRGKPPHTTTRGQQRGGGEDRAGSFQHSRSKLLTASSNSLLQKQGLHQVELRIGPSQRRTAEESTSMHRNGHPGGNSPDSEDDEDAMTDPAAGVTALRIEDNHTELHLFLPQLATSPSSLSKGGSVASPGSQQHSGSPARGHPSSSSAAMDSTLLPHIDNGKKNGSLTRQRSFGAHKCRSPQKRFRSPTKVFRDSSLKAGYSSEPFERNENLREKLEDVPTLVSLDAES